MSLPKLGVASGATLAEHQICHPHPQQLPPPQWPLAVAGHNSLPKGMPGSSAGSPSPPATHASVSPLWQPDANGAQLSCLTILSWQETAACPLLSTPLVLYL